jgi:hypothetical protein
MGGPRGVVMFAQPVGVAVVAQQQRRTVRILIRSHNHVGTLGLHHLHQQGLAISITLLIFFCTVAT